MYKEETRYGKRLFWWIIGACLLIGALVTTCNLVWKTTKKATHIEDAVQVYEEFQEIYNTCYKLNIDLCNIREADEKDKMFEQFSKAQRVLTLQTNLNRWVNDYNAKSKMWGRNLWKSKKLPYELSVDNFNCYNLKN